MKKLKEHVYQKILKLDESVNSNQPTGVTNETSSNAGHNQRQSSSTNSLSNNSNSSNGVADANDVCSAAHKTIELICSDNVSCNLNTGLFYLNIYLTWFMFKILNDAEMSLRTIKHLIWKGSGDLTILYRIKT